LLISTSQSSSWNLYRQTADIWRVHRIYFL